MGLPTTTGTAQSQPRLHFDAAMLSNVGAVRTLNEDVVLYAPPQDGAAGRGTLALVAGLTLAHTAGPESTVPAATVVATAGVYEDSAVPAAAD